MPASIVMFSRKFGKWEVISSANEKQCGDTLWNCRCDCGVERKIPGKNLRKGLSQSCGCTHRESFNRREKVNRSIDIAGQTFGRLTTKEKVKVKDGMAQWSCDCSCGTKDFEAMASQLRAGIVRSCGCLRVENSSAANKLRALPFGQAAFNTVIGYYKRGAERRGHDFKLTPEEFRDLINKDCYYCSSAPATKRTSGNSFIIYNGIDRVDNTKGYTKDNTVPCCKCCNQMKLSMTSEQFINKCENIVITKTLRRSEDQILGSLEKRAEGIVTLV